MHSIRRLEQTGGGGGNSEQSSCDCSSSSSSSTATASQCSRGISILYQGDEFRSYLEYHAVNYQLVHPHITIQLLELPGSPQASPEVWASSSSTTTTTAFLEGQEAFEWDGAIFPSHLTGAMAKSQRLADLKEYIYQQERGGDDGTKNIIDWTSILPFYRHQQSTYDYHDQQQQILSIPLDGDVLSLYYRRDLFEQHNLTVPRTWEEYQTVAAFFHNQPWGGGGGGGDPNANATLPMAGSCVPFRLNCANAYWASMILSTMTQAEGTSTGYLLDPVTTEPLLGPAMEETLWLLEQQQLYAGPIEKEEERVEADCLAVNVERFNQGLCAMTFHFGNQLLSGRDSEPFLVGVAPTPGSTRILNRKHGVLEECTPDTCPYGVYHQDLDAIVNQPAYSAFGGWVAGVSNTTSAGKQRAVADFFSYMSNTTQSLPDVLPNQISSFADPYRYSHVSPSSWENANGFYERTTAQQYTDAIRQINSENSVLEFRSPPGASLREIMDEEISNYLSQMQDIGAKSTNTLELRKNVTEVIATRMQEAIAEVGTTMNMTEVYQKSIGYSADVTEVNMNYIDPDFRAAGWGLAGLICLLSLVLITWTFSYERNRVMQAFQPFLLIQCAIGLFFLGASIVPLGFDDSLFDESVLDITCAATPWIYILGFSIFYSSVYAKIRMCVKIFKDPTKYDVMVVHQMDFFKIFLRVFLLNGILLALWTGLDPLKWTRQEVSNGEMSADGTVESFGACRGEGMSSLGFSVALFVLNLTFCLVGTLQAFSCRFLVLEYNEIQWLPLSLLPFFEAWIIGGPLLIFINEKPTVVFVTLTLIIVVSSLTAVLAVFAPKDWYIRKYNGKDEEMARSSGNRTSPAGVHVLNHPTVESRRQVAKLQKQLEQINAYNTELVIDIGEMKQKFHQMTERQKSVSNERMQMDGAANTVDSSTRQQSASDYEKADQTIGGNESGLVAMEHFASVWTTDDDDDLADDLSEGINDEEVETPNPANATTSMRSSLQSGTAGSLENDSVGEAPASNPGGIIAGVAAGGAALLGGFVYARKSMRKVTEDSSKGDDNTDVSDIEQGDTAIASDARGGDSYDYRSESPFPTKKESLHMDSFPPPGPLPTGNVSVDSCRSFAEDSTGPDLVEDDIYALDKTIESDDLVALEAEALMLAEQFKMTCTLLESASDLQKNTNDEDGGFNRLDISKITTSTGDFEDQDMTVDNSMFGSPQRSVNKSTASTEIMNDNSSPTAMPLAGDSSGDVHYSSSRNLETIEGRSTQFAGEPSGYRSSPTYDNEEVAGDDGDDDGDDDNDDDDQHHMRPPIPMQYQSPRKRVARIPSGRRSARSSSPQAHGSPVSTSSRKNLSYTIADWSAVGMTGGLLADLSDSTSTASHAESYIDSELGDSTRGSDLDFPPLTKEIDRMVAYSDFDAVKAAADSYEASSAGNSEDENSESARLAKIRERKEKKRELEAWRTSLSKSFEKEG